MYKKAPENNQSHQFSFAKDEKFIVAVVSSWCPACHRTIPYLEYIKKQTGLPVYAILYKDSRAKFYDFYPEHKLLFESVIIDGNITAQLKFKTIPQIYAVKNNKVLHVPHSLTDDSTLKVLKFFEN